MADLKKLRKVLDYTPSKDVAGWKDRSQYDAVTRRLNRDVVAETPAPKPAKDEAVLVVDPQEWKAALEARERERLLEAELERLREELARTHERSEELQRELDDLRRRLAGLRDEQERRRVALQLVGVKGRKTQPTAEELAARGWEVMPEDEEPAALEPAKPEPESPREQVSAPTKAKLSERLVATEDDTRLEDAIRRVEQEIHRVEGELDTLGKHESALRAKGLRNAYRHDGYVLYHRRVGRGDKARDVYFFSTTPPEAGDPVPLPEGYQVVVNHGTGMPHLKAKTGPKRRPTKRRRRTA